MGDRGGILISGEEYEHWIYLYTHWGRSHLISDIKKGLKKLYNFNKNKVDLHCGPKEATYIFAEMISHGVHDCEIDAFGIEDRTEIERMAVEHALNVELLVIIGGDLKIFDYQSGTLTEASLEEFMAGIYKARKFEDCDIFKQYYEQKEKEEKENKKKEREEQKERKKLIEVFNEKKAELKKIKKDSIIKAKESCEKREMIKNIILLGDIGVGKTTLIIKYLVDKFNPVTKLTNCVDLYLKKISVDNRNLTIFIWDILGDYSFHFLLEYFIKKLDGAIILFDLPRANTIENTSEWVKSARKNNPNLPILFIGTKLDKAEDIWVDDDYVLEFKEKFNLFDYLKVSSKTGENVDETFSRIISETIKTSSSKKIDYNLLEKKLTLLDYLKSLKIQDLEKEIKEYWRECGYEADKINEIYEEMLEKGRHLSYVISMPQIAEKIKYYVKTLKF